MTMKDINKIVEKRLEEEEQWCKRWSEIIDTAKRRILKITFSVFIIQI